MKRLEIPIIIIEMTKAKNAMSATDWIAIGVAVLAAIIALSGSILSYNGNKETIKAAKESSQKSVEVSQALGDLNASSLDKQRLIDSISAQRIEWINKLRDTFVEFNKYTHTYSMLRFSQNFGKNLGYNHVTDYQNIIGVKNHIELLLNPNEYFTEKLLFHLDGLINSLHSSDVDFNIIEYNKQKKRISFIQQVILKSEWKRIKTETENGKQVSDKEMNDIFIIVAKKIDKDIYNELTLS